ncbi:MAG: hypothetical protein ABSD68_02390 [Candidatus Micrarchaeales archaeon]
MPKKKKEKGESKILYLNAESVEDLCRYVCRFDFASSTLILSESSKENRLIAIGERIGETQIAYYADVKGSGSTMVYEPAIEKGKDKVQFTEKTEMPNKYYINVIRLNLGTFATTKNVDKKKVQLIRVKNQIDLIAAAIRRSAKDEAMANIYSFISGKKQILAAFDVLESLSIEKPILYYAFAEAKIAGNFARYDYRNSVLDFTNTISEHAYLYAKIINLAEAFPFFKQANK